jgi:hypothetical protein
MSSISHSILTTVSMDDDRWTMGDGRWTMGDGRWDSGGSIALHDAEDVGRVLRIAIAGAVGEFGDADGRHRAVGLGVRGDEQGAGRRDQLGGAVAVNRHALEQPRGGRRGHREQPVLALHHAAADVQRRGLDVFDAEPLEAEHGAHNIDDRIEGTDLVQVHLLDRRAVDRRLGGGEPLEHVDGTVLPFARERRPPDGIDDALEVVVGMPAVFSPGTSVGETELRRGHAGALDGLGTDLTEFQREAAERAPQVVEGQTEVEQSAQDHVARRAGKTIEIEHRVNAGA